MCDRLRCVGCTAGYITGVLEDARVYSGHAGKKELDVSDVRLAVQTRVDHSFTTPPPRDVSSCVHQRKFLKFFGTLCIGLPACACLYST